MHPVLSGSVLYSILCSSVLFKHFFLWLFVRSFSTQLFFLVLFSGLFSGLSLLSDSVDFSYSKGSFFLIFSGLFVGLLLPRFFFFFFFFFLLFFFFLFSGSVLSNTPYIGLLCLLRMHAINSCVGDTRQRR